MREESFALLFLAFHLLLLAASQTFFLADNLMSIRALARRILFTGQLQIQASEKSKHLLATEPLPAWVELKGEPIEVQEFLQSVVREFQRRAGENRASEDTWSFVRYLNDCEGYVRVQTSTHFQGYGKPTGEFSGQAATRWPLNPKGILEQELIGVLQTRFKHAALKPFQSAATGCASAFIMSACNNRWNRCSPASRRTDRRPAT